MNINQVHSKFKQISVQPTKSGFQWLGLFILLLIPHCVVGQTFDVQHYHIELKADNAILKQKQIKGKTTLRLQSLTENLKTVTLELKKLSVSSVKKAGKQVKYNQIDNKITIELDKPIAKHDTFSLEIVYGGSPAAPSFFGGVYYSNDVFFTIGIDIANTPHNAGKTWFPCVDNFSDKASYSFAIETSQGMVAVANGLMVNKKVDPKTQNETYYWDLPQPIPTYLASVAVGNFGVWKSSYNSINGKSIPIEIYASKARVEKIPQTFENLPVALRIFEDYFGPYPFNRIGYVGVPFSGGAMEHATNIAFPAAQIDGTKGGELLYVHELAHAWFGNWVTCSSSGDMWLNEGFASFCEGLFIEKTRGTAAFQHYLLDLQNKVLTQTPYSDGGLLPVCCVSDENTYGSTVYDKGAWIAHALRQEVGDSAFFAGLRSYFQDYAFGNVTNNDLCATLSKAAGRDLKPWFDAFVYQPGSPNIVLFGLLCPGTADIPIGADGNYCESYWKISSTDGQWKTPSTIVGTEVPIRYWAAEGKQYYDINHSLTISSNICKASKILPDLAAIPPILDPYNWLADASFCQEKSGLVPDTSFKYVYASLQDCEANASLPTICWTVGRFPNLATDLNAALGYWQVGGAEDCKVQFELPVQLLTDDKARQKELYLQPNQLKVYYSSGLDSAPELLNYVVKADTKKSNLVVINASGVRTGYYTIAY